MNKQIVFLWLWVSVAIERGSLRSGSPGQRRWFVVVQWRGVGLAGRFRRSQRGAPGGRDPSARPGPGAETVFGTGQVEIMDHVARLQGSTNACPMHLVR